MPSLLTIADGYFKAYGRAPAVPYTSADLTYIRDYAAKLIGETKFSEFQSFLYNMAVRYGVDISEAQQYINNHPDYLKTITSAANLEGGSAIEAIGNGVKTVITEPVKWFAGMLGDAVGGALGNAIKGIAPPVILIAGGYLLFKHLSKKAGKK